LPGRRRALPRGFFMAFPDIASKPFFTAEDAEERREDP
jgi:hypothetical protein